jgi:hypothetical protein
MAHEFPKRLRVGEHPGDTDANLYDDITGAYVGALDPSRRSVADAIAAEIVRRWNAFEALAKLADEFGCTLDQYNKNGPHWTHKDGTQVFDVAVVLDRAGLIEEARAAVAPDATGE